MIERSTVSSNSSEKLTAYQEQLDRIATKALTPENIDTYADQALDDLIALIHSITCRYRQLPTIASNNSRGAEELAFQYFNLTNIESCLDYIADLSDSIHSLDNTINQALKVDTVMIPPQHIDDMRIEASTGTYDKKKLTPRLKTVLFIMQQELQINIHDQSQLHLTKGKVTESTMRGASYCSVLTPTINRLSFINDEEGNASYVFDLGQLKESKIDYQDLSDLTKTQLNELISSIHGIGKRIVYSKEYINNIMDALSSPLNANDQPSQTTQSARVNKNTYLLPRMPIGYKSLSAIARDLHKVKHYIEEVVATLGPTLGEVGTYLSGVRTTTAFSPAQQDLIGEYINSKVGEPVPTDYQSVRALGRTLNIRTDTVRAAIDQLGDALGEVKEYRFKSKTTIGYSPAQQRMIREYLDSNNLLTEKAPSDILNVASIARRHGVSDSVIQSATVALGSALGEVKVYRFHTTSADGYSSEQQQMILDYLNSVNALAEKAPDDYMSARGISLKINTGYSIVQRAIASVYDQLGVVTMYKFGAKVTEGFSPGQIEVIESYVKQHSRYYNSTKGIGKSAVAQALSDDK